MKVRRLHSQESPTPSEAVALQKKLAARLKFKTPKRLSDRIEKFLADPAGHPLTIAGADISHNRFSSRLFAAVTVVRLPDFALVETARFEMQMDFPYIPGLLAFRESPPILGAFEKLKSAPDVIFCDGHGLAHMRGMGVACHIGLALDAPTVGVAKSPLVGDFKEPGRAAGGASEFVFNGRTVGFALRTRDGVKPIFISPGHKIGFGRIAALVMAACNGVRIPEPTRQAHLAANAFRKEVLGT